MRNKKIILIFLVILLSLSGLTYYIYTKGDKKTTLNLLEKQWIEKNKNNVIDMGIVSNVPIFTESGNGLFFEFLTSLGDETGLSFNYVPYAIGSESESKYAFSVVDKKEKNDVSVYSDNYVLVGRENNKIISTSELKKSTIGVINADLDNVNKYVDSSEVSYKAFDDMDALVEAFTTIKVVGDVKEGETTANELDMMAIPKVLYMKLISEKGYFINYQITEMTKHYVIRLGDEARLNDILTKYYKKWASDNYVSVFASYFSSSYFDYNLINEKETVNFKSKNYNYGYVDFLPLDFEINGKLYGVSNSLLKSFEERADIQINYVKYKDISALNEAFKNKKVDLIINYGGVKENVSTSFYPKNYVVVTKNSNNITVNSLNSLEGREVYALKNTEAETMLNDAKAKVKTFNTLEQLVSKASKNSIMLLDSASFDIYEEDKLKNYKVDYEVKINNYNYQFNDQDVNKVFNDYLNFFISLDNQNALFNESELDIIANYGKINVKLGLYISLALFVAIVSAIFIGLKLRNKKVKKPKAISKEDKLKYIDMLTSLKNRNYLNDNLEKWDSSEVYPQAILVIDLNNVAYINDNYGHAEGDNVIREAANKLIMTQESGSDIIRTSGNEFLIYLVGHDEKSVVAYKRKLAKEFKDISHGFGAAIGYSMIMDGIKTIDDAINEATLDMRNNKESQNN